MRRWRERGHLGVEMEAAVLYTIGAMHGIETLALVTDQRLLADDGTPSGSATKSCAPASTR